MSKRPTVNTNPVAHQYSGPGERIVEFSNNIAADHKGGLIAFRNFEDGRLLVDVYRTDPGVEVRVSTYTDPLASTLVSWWGSLTAEERGLLGLPEDEGAASTPVDEPDEDVAP